MQRSCILWPYKLPCQCCASILTTGRHALRCMPHLQHKGRAYGASWAGIMRTANPYKLPCRSAQL